MRDSIVSTEDNFATRRRLLKAAAEQFAERGFYGASIARIAGELGLTKQALLYHFKRKEDLYAEVLKGISDRLLLAMQGAQEVGQPPEKRLEKIVLAIYESALENPVDAKVLMRELLDNQRKDVPEEERYLKVFLDSIVGMLDQIDGVSQLPFAQKLARIYAVISSIEYFAASGFVIARFYGEDEYERICEAYGYELKGQVRHLVTPAG